MAIAVVIETDGDARGMIAWGARLARCHHTPLLVIHATKSDGPAEAAPVPLDDSDAPASGLAAAVLEAWNAARELLATEFGRLPSSETGGGSGDEQNSGDDEHRYDEHRYDEHRYDENRDDEHREAAGRHKAGRANGGSAGLELSFLRVRGPRVTDAVLERLAGWGVELLIVPASSAAGGDDGVRRLFDRASCATMLLRATAAPTPDRPIVVPTAGHAHDHAALQLAARLGQCEGRGAAALYVELDVGDVSAMVGRRIARRNIALAFLSSEADVEPRVVVCDKLERGIREGAQAESCELLLLGVRANVKSGAQTLGRAAQRLIKWADGPSIALLRPALPLHRRFLYRVESWLEDQLPQLTREERVSLVGRIQSGSQWNIDFVALICLSTLIAALGLVRNSPAVVIGAMLVAPLMTPLMGAGLALIQGNLILARSAAASVLGGFFVALLVSGVLGLLIFGLQPSPEMLGRGSPGVLDLLVAFVSGMAAAYAVGRPNLSSALPGVAIAAALVPPIATSGMSLAIGELVLALGALLLFVTNIVAIVLGSAVGLWAVGVRGRHQHGGYERWSAWAVTALVVATIGLAAYESQPAPTLPSSMEAGLQHEVFGYMADARLDFPASQVRRRRGAVDVYLVLRRAFAPPPDLAAALRERISQEFDEPVTLHLRTELSSVAAPPEPAGPAGEPTAAPSQRTRSTRVPRAATAAAGS